MNGCRPLRAWSLAAVAAAAAVAGCSEPTVCVVQGTVKVAGAPIEMGMVSLEWLEGGRPPASAAIVKGMFEVSERARLEPGRYLVRVTAPDLSKCDPSVTPTPERPNPFVSLVGDRWNATSDLTLTLAPGRNRVAVTGPRAGPPTLGTGLGSAIP